MKYKDLKQKAATVNSATGKPLDVKPVSGNQIAILKNGEEIDRGTAGYVSNKLDDIASKLNLNI